MQFCQTVVPHSGGKCKKGHAGNYLLLRPRVAMGAAGFLGPIFRQEGIYTVISYVLLLVIGRPYTYTKLYWRLGSIYDGSNQVKDKEAGQQPLYPVFKGELKFKIISLISE